MKTHAKPKTVRKSQPRDSDESYGEQRERTGEQGENEEEKGEKGEEREKFRENERK
jgi:hypothetical protein